MTDETPEQTPATWPTPTAPQAGSPVPAPSYPVAPATTAPVGTSTNAIVALVLAVLSWAICPLIPAIVSLVFASMGAKEIAASGGRVDGRGLITAARIVSWINIGVFVAGILAIAFIALIAAVV